MFENCHFLLGKGNSIVIVVPTELPNAETFTVSVSRKDIKFRADYDEIAAIPYENREVFERIAYAPQIGLVEYSKDSEFPSEITAIAYVEVRRTVQ